MGGCTVYLTWNRLTIIDPDDPLTGSRPLAHSRRWTTASARCWMITKQQQRKEELLPYIYKYYSTILCT